MSGSSHPSRALVLEAAKHREHGVQMALELLEVTNACLFQTLGGMRRVEWAHIRVLDEPFRSENCETAHGE